MPYLADVLALNPTLHWPLDEADGSVIDATGNGYNGDILSLSGTQYVRRVESIVRNLQTEPTDRATLLNTSLSATSGVGRVRYLPSPQLNMSGNYTLALWARWKGSTASLVNIILTGGVGAGSIELWHFGSSEIRVTHQSLGVTTTVSWTGLNIRPDSRHFYTLVYNRTTAIVYLYVDGVNLGPRTLPVIDVSYTGISVLYMGDTFSAPQRPLRHYIQHASIWQVTLGGSVISDLWVAGRSRPLRSNSYVDFSEPQYTAGVSVVGTSRWEKVFNTGFVSYGVVENSGGALGGRVLNIRSGANNAAIKWNEIFREPLQRFETRARVTAGFNFEFGIILLGGWDYTTMSSFAGSVVNISGIEIGVSGNNLQVRQKVNGVISTLATAAFVRAAGDWFRLKGEVDTTTKQIRAKIWADADPEPLAWTIDIGTMDNAFYYGEGFFVLHTSVANTFIDVDYINLAYNVGFIQPVLDEVIGGSYDVIFTAVPGAISHQLEYSLNGVDWIVIDDNILTAPDGNGNITYPWNTTVVGDAADVLLRARGVY